MFRIAPLAAEVYYSWSDDLEVVLRRKRLLRFVGNDNATQPVSSSGDIASPESNTDDASAQCIKKPSETDEQKRDLVLTYILTSMVANFKVTVC